MRPVGKVEGMFGGSVGHCAHKKAIDRPGQDRIHDRCERIMIPELGALDRQTRGGAAPLELRERPPGAGHVGVWVTNPVLGVLES